VTRGLVYQRCVRTRNSLNLAGASFHAKVGVYPFWTRWESVRISTENSDHAHSQLLVVHQLYCKQIWLFWGGEIEVFKAREFIIMVG
jgi:hypothetical protein